MRERIVTTLILVFFIYKLSSQTVLDKMVDHIGNSIETDYQNGEKWIAFIKGSIGIYGGMIMIDMADLAGVTEEGKDGWVTVWANASVGIDKDFFGKNILPVDFGFYKRSYDPNAPDSPDYLLSASANLETPGFSIVSIGIEIDGENELYVDLIEPKAESGMTISAGLGLNINVISIEIKKSELDKKLINYLVPGIQVENYASNIFNIALNPSANTWKGFLSGLPRISTPQDDPNFALTKSIYYDQLVVGQWGNVYVDVRVNTDNYYKQRVWDNGGILYPKWDWNNAESGPDYLSAGALKTFTYQVKPTSESERFEFWLYEYDGTILGLDTYRIIEKIEDSNPIYALPEGTDVSGPSVQYILFEGKVNSEIIVVFNESINPTAFTNGLISITGSISGSISSEFQLTSENKILTIIPDELFTPGETITLILSNFIQDIQSNRMNQSFVANYDISGSSVCTDLLEPNNASEQAFTLGTSNSYYNNALCLSAADEDWFSFVHNSNNYYFKVTGDNELTSGDYTLQFNITADELNILTEFATEFTDTKVYLYDDQLNQLAFDDNSNGVFGWITYDLPTETAAEGPNVSLENAFLNKLFIEPGDSYAVSGELTNNGDESTGQAFRIKYYLSDDIYVSADDDYLDFNIYNTLSADAIVPLNHDFTSNEDQPDGNYYFLVYVDANEEIEESNESNVFAFPITIGDVAIPVLTSPVDDAENVAKNPTFSWSAVTGAESYDFAIYIGYTQVYFSGDLQTTSTNPSYEFEYGENYKWTARATVNGNTGDWAVLSSFEIRPYLDIPFLIAPSNGASNVELFPTFSWDELDAADYYKIEVSPESEFSPDFNYRNIMETSFKMDDDDLAESTLYYWRVRGYSDQGASDYSQVYTFTTGGGIAPGAPSIQSPSNNEALASTTPAILWQPGEGVTHSYQLEIASDIGFSNVIFTKNQIEFTEYQVPQNVLDPNTSYYARLSGRNSQGYSNQSGIVQFVTGESLTGPGSIQWTKTFDNLNYQGGSVPVFDYQGYMYISFPGTSLSTIHKVDPNTGQTILTIFDNEVNIEEYQEPTFSHDGKTMYFIGDASTVHYPDSDYEYLVAVNTQGEMLWATDLTLYSNNWKPALDASGNIYVYGEDYSHRDNRPDQDALVSVDSNGNIRWTTTFSNQSASSIGNPVVAGDKVFIAREEDASNNGKIIAINTSNGSTMWTKNLPSDELYERNGGNPSLSNSYMVFPTTDDQLYKVNISNGGNVSGWPKVFSERSSAVSVIDENEAVFNGLDDDNITLMGKAYSLTSAGSSRWNDDIPGSFMSSSVLGNDGIWYFGGNDGTIYAYDKDTGAEIWSSNLGKIAYGMTIGPEGTLYVSTETGPDGIGLYAFNTNATGLNAGSWPVKHHDNQGTGNYDHSPITYEFPLPAPAISSQNITNTAFELSWTAVDEATSYFIDISVDDFSTFLDGYENLELMETNLVVSSLNERGTYQVRIKSNNEDTESIYSQLNVTTSSNAAPSSALLLSTEIDENMDIGTLVGEIQVNDADVTDTHLIELVPGEGDDDNGSFAISNGNLISQESFDFETKNLYSIRLRATDNLGASIEEIYLIEVIDVFEKFDQTIDFEPVVLQIFGGDDYDLGISSSSALPVNIVSHNPQVVTIENGIMSIVSSGQTLISATNDGNEYYNAAPKVTRTILVDKAWQEINIEAPLILKVTDEDYPLTAVSSSGLDVAYQIENEAVAQIVNDTYVHVVGAGHTNLFLTQSGNVNYYAADTLSIELTIEKLDQYITIEPIPAISLGDDPISINASSSSGLAPDYTVVSGPGEFANNNLTINDGGKVIIQITQSGDAVYNSTSLEIELNVNYPPVSIDLNNNLIDENSESETIVGTFSANDRDQAANHVFQLETGALDNEFFLIYESNQLISNTLFDFESNVSYNIRVIATDLAGARYIQEFTIAIQDINEAPVISDNTYSVNENAVIASFVGTVVGSDPESGELAYSITDGNELGAFQIGQQTGEITIADSEPLDFESNPTFLLSVEVSDGEFSALAEIRVDLTDLNEAPSINESTFAIAENSVAGTAVGTVLSSDPDGDELSLSIIDGNEQGAFLIDTKTAEITVANSELLDYETLETFNLSIEVTDGEFTSTAIITVNLTDIDETVTGIDGQGNLVRLYPNPTDDFVEVDWKLFKEAIVYDLSGKELLLKSANPTLDLRTLQPGPYLIQLLGTNKERLIFRIIKE